MQPLIRPDFTRSVLNVSATLAEFLGCPNTKPTLPVLKRELEKGYRNVVFLIADGLGMHPIEKNLPKTSFLQKNLAMELTSVFPSTTTCATTSMLTNLYPMEHGWFGWSLYFEELGRAVELFPETDHYTGEECKGFVRSRLPVVPFYQSAKNDYRVAVIAHSYCDYAAKERYLAEDFDTAFAKIRTLCNGQGKHFLYVYCPEPDATMHRFGVTSQEAKRVIGGLDARLKALCGELEDTLFVITADHGQINVEECIPLYADETLGKLLRCPPYLEARAAAFKVNMGCEKAFVDRFNAAYGADFLLLDTATLIRENYFGEGGASAPDHAALLGDYIAVGITNKIFRLSPRGHDFRGHHTSLTEEMRVPLILVP